MYYEEDILLFEQFFLSVQQDVKLFIFFPFLCAIFRAVFIGVHKPYSSLAGKGKAIWHCFRFGFWWGMDINAFVFVYAVILVTLPGLFFGSWNSAGDILRLILGGVYAVVLYGAFAGKMIFYAQFHDIFNNIVFLGQKAEKNNLIDIFFNQYHGLKILICIIPYMAVVLAALKGFLLFPSIPYPALTGITYYAFNTIVVLALIAAFYFFRYGGTFMHDNKPEWDTIPAVVKEDPFLSKATVDDLIALKLLRKYPTNAIMAKSDTENLENIRPFIEQRGGSIDTPTAFLDAFRHTAKGPKITKPSHVFFIVGESYSQPYFDPAFAKLHIADEGKKLMASSHTASISTTLSAGVISRPSIVSLMLGIFDAELELNEKEAFWQGTVPTSLPLQLRKLGYETNYWYGGSLSHGNFKHFAPACGFHHAYSAIDICDPKAPRSWVGVYDHIFLNKAAELIKAEDGNKLQFHFIYTTSNHGPYKLPLKELGFDPEKVMDVQQDVLSERIIPKVLGAYWYSDQAINTFIQDMKTAYPDSLFIVTGDHGAQCGELQHTSFMNREYTFRERRCPVLLFNHREITKDSLANNVIGGHMNILPTLFELIAPAGFTYYSMFDSLTEPVTHCVTPNYWVNNECIGSCEKEYYQKLTALSGQDVEQGTNPYRAECAAEKSLTAYILQHPEVLRPMSELLQ
jgi:hypothetical protein